MRLTLPAGLIVRRTNGESGVISERMTRHARDCGRAFCSSTMRAAISPSPCSGRWRNWEESDDEALRSVKTPAEKDAPALGETSPISSDCQGTGTWEPERRRKLAWSTSARGMLVLMLETVMEMKPGESKEISP